MELRHLRYFLAVAEELSFSRAAKRLHIAQPPLSQQIRDLEREIGLQLFDRSRRNIILTLAGRDFLADTRLVLDGISRLEQKTQLRSEGILGRVSIGVNTAIVTPHFFASMLSGFQRRNPGIKFSLVDYHSVKQIEALLSGEIDIGLLRPPSQMPALIQSHRMKLEAMRVAVPTDHVLAKKKKIAWTDLADEQLILIQPEIVRNFYDEFYVRCRKAGFEPRVQQYVSTLATQLWLISAGLGIAPMPITPEIEKRSGVTFVELPADSPVYETVMAWRKDDQSPVLQRFVQFVRQEKQV